MAEQVVVALKITSDAQTGGIKVTTGSLQDLERAAGRAGSQWEKLGNTVAKKFSGADIGKQLLQGLGLGSGFAVAQQAANQLVEYYRTAAERAKSIADHSERQLAAVRARIALEQTQPQQLVVLQKNTAAEQGILEGQRAASQITPTAGGFLRALGLRYGLPVSVGQSQGQEEDVRETERKIDDLSLATGNLKKQLEAAANAERALLSEAQKYAQEVKKINELVGPGGLTRAEADARIAQLDLERAQKKGQQVADVQATRAEEDRQIAAARKRVNDTLKESADRYRELADPQFKYQQQLQEIDALTKISGANGKPFLSAQDAAAAKARVLAEMNDLAGKAIRATRAEVEAYDFALEALDKNPALSDLEKQRERLRLIEEQTAAIRRAQQALTDFQQANPGVDVGGITSALVSLGDKAARNAGLSQPAQTLAQRDAIAQRDLGDPGKHYQSAGAGLAGGLAQQAASIGTLGDQVARGWANAGDSIRSSWGATISDMILRASSLKDAVLGFGSAIVTGFIGAGAQMVADWLYQHTVMAGIKSLFKSKDIAETTAAEGAKTAVTAAGEATRTGIVASAAAANTAVVTTEAGVIAGATGVAGVFRSIMELGPIAGPAVFATSVAAMIALVASLAQGFAEGGIVRGPGTATSDSIVARLSNGEAVLNARATAMLGEDFVHRANAGALDLMALSGQIGSHLPAAADAAMGARGFGGDAAGGAAAAAAPRVYVLMDRSEFVRAMQEDSGAWFEDMSKTFQRKNA